ncbi:hypothetical protein [Herbaspirillum sp. VT-16-41]|uniref:hypothetical protein n=1 Tax=Herbaspirillum sp. VT-16-41 TaxID=1953765 RepID=UPI00143E0E80|nr:hypothetical protein [Herbaspirillum sp. VT-16-41]
MEIIYTISALELVTKMRAGGAPSSLIASRFGRTAAMMDAGSLFATGNETGPGAAK